MLNKEDIIIIIICILLSLILMAYLNKRINCKLPNCYCCKKYKTTKGNYLDMYKEQFKNNSLKDNIRFIETIEKSDKELELL